MALSDPVIVALAWPDEAGRREQLAAAGIPRLLVLAAGERPPGTWAPDEDWVAGDADPVERAHRERTLRGRLAAQGRSTGRVRGTAALDAEGLLHRDGRWVALSTIEAALVARLLAAEGRAVSRPTLLAAGWPGRARGGRTVDSAIRRVRAKVAPLGLVIHGLTGVGYLLEG